MCARSAETPRAAPARSGERYAFVQGTRLWLEGADTLLAVLDGGPVVAPDGRALAYWARDLFVTNAPPELTVLDLLSGASRTFAVQDDARGGPLAWSCDGMAVLVEARKATPPVQGPIVFPGPPEYSALRLIDLRTGAERELARFPGEDVVPLAWNAHLRFAAAAAQRADPRGGARAYVAVRDDGSVSRWDLPNDPAWSTPRIDAGASRLVATEIGVPPESALLRWRIDDTSRPAVVARPATGESIVDVRYVPGSTDPVVVVRENKLDAAQRVESWPDGPQASRRVLVGPLLGQDRLDIFARADGSTYARRSSYQTGLIDLLRVDPGGRVESTLPSPMVPTPGESVVTSDQALATIRPSALRAALGRQQAIDAVGSLTDKVKRLDRGDAKLIQWRDLFRVYGLVDRSNARPDQVVWAVALAGRIEAASGAQRIPLRWGVWFLDAETGKVLDFATDARETYVWPQWWDGLIDRGPEPPIRSLPAPTSGRPVDFFPQSPCGFVTDTIREPGQLVWLLDCTPELDRQARRTIGPMLERQQWVPCGSGLASASWRLRERITGVSEGSGIAPNYIRLTQRPRSPGEC